MVVLRVVVEESCAQALDLVSYRGIAGDLVLDGSERVEDGAVVTAAKHLPDLHRRAVGQIPAQQRHNLPRHNGVTRAGG
jgi:hypothetical protein